MAAVLMALLNYNRVQTVRPLDWHRIQMVDPLDYHRVQMVGPLDYQGPAGSLIGLA